MPSHDIKSVLETKPLSFTLKTSGGKWKCTLHSNRQALEKSRSVADRSPITRADSDMSISSATSTTSSHQ
ncbi:hypothetical protein PG990_009722 [Apiospora arundinis]|uniref:Uncharacterized protein n=1 Tax=Apiospora arundinis TaxID=335852 RepID=A0ABR2IUH5_9PEZI